ncbi:AI-2E family transporter [Tabrizicola sp. BL-A-41-H6]|uniref:AI-2E family transporter n=1 Tax=Tabrizicola sp. BL-A-41-H6 TaxID=3421107 RepID=UPI003D66EB59
MKPNVAAPKPHSAHEIEDSRVTDRVIRIGFLGLFAYWSIGLVLPFVGIAVWSVILAVALNPLYQWVAKLFGGRRGLAAAAVTLGVFSVIAGPIALLAANLVESAMVLANALEDGTLLIPPPPPGIASWPVVGEGITNLWTLASTNLEAALRTIWTEPRAAAAAFATRLSSISGDVALFLLAILISGFLYKPGPKIVDAARLFASRLVAPRGAALVEMAGATIRSVSQGVIGLAFLEALLAGVVLLLAGVPMAGLIAFGILVLSLVQIGPLPVLLPLLVWTWMTQSTSLALVVTAAAVVILLMDNLLKPLVIKRGLKSPTLVVLAGVIGGTISHGMIGLFLGPVVLAIFYELLVAWTLYDAPEDTTKPEAL